MRSKAKRRVAILLAAGLLLTLVIVISIGLGNRDAEARLEAERAAAMADYQSGNYAAALPHLQRYLEKSRDGEKAATPGYLQALFACGKCRMNVRQGHADNLVAAKDIFLSYLAFRPGDLETEHLLLEIYPQIDYQREQLTLADSILQGHPDDIPALTSRILALLMTSVPKYEEALATCDHLNASAPLDLRGQLLAMEIRASMHVPPQKLIERAESLRQSHKNDPRFELLLGATYLGASTGLGSGTAPATQESALPPDLTAASGLPATNPADATLETWRDEGRRWLQAAADRSPPDPQFVRQFVLTLDLHNLFPQSLQVLVKDAPVLHDRGINGLLVRRLWENGFFKQVVEQTAQLNRDDPSANCALLGLRASSLLEESVSAASSSAPRLPATTQAGEAAAIVQVLSSRSADPIAAAWAILIQARYISQGIGPRVLLKQCQAAIDRDPENPLAFLIAGEAYLGLGEQESAASAWSRAAAYAPEWALPYARLADLRLQQGRTNQARVSAAAALARAPRVARRARCERRRSVRHTQASTPRTQPRAVGRTAVGGRVDSEYMAQRTPYPSPVRQAAMRNASEGTKQSRWSTRPHPRTPRLRPRHCWSWTRSAGRRSWDSAMPSWHVPTGAMLQSPSAKPWTGALPAMPRAGWNFSSRPRRLLMAKRAARGISRSPLIWNGSRIRERWRLGSRRATRSPKILRFSRPSRARTAACRTATSGSDRSIGCAQTGDDGQLWRLERCRWLLTEGDGVDPRSGAAAEAIQKDRSEAITTLSELVRQFPSAPEPHLLLARATGGREEAAARDR